MSDYLKITNLRKEYNEFVLDNISLSLPRGLIMGLIGPNGAGKTTTIKLVMNFISSNGGEIEVLGLDHRKFEAKIKNLVGYVGEEQYFYEQHTALWTGRFVSHFYDKWNSNRFLELLERFDLPPRKLIRKYSRGMKVKLSMALALSHEAELIILDEPTSGLDPIARREVLDILMEITRKEDKAVFISSHITSDIERIADLITYIVNGQIVLSEAKDELFSRWKKIHFSSGSLPDDIRRFLTHLQEHAYGGSGLISNYQEIRDRLASEVSRGDIKFENVNLDDILISLAKKRSKC